MNGVSGFGGWVVGGCAAAAGRVRVGGDGSDVRGGGEGAGDGWLGVEGAGGRRDEEEVTVIWEGINHERRSSCTFCLEAVSASVTK